MQGQAIDVHTFSRSWKPFIPIEQIIGRTAGDLERWLIWNVERPSGPESLLWTDRTNAR